MQAGDLDKVARSHLKKYNLADFFNHALGHGLGLEIHSLPRIGSMSKDIISNNSVVALEPGVYIPNLGGIRIEDDIVISQNGNKILTPPSRELTCVE